MKVLIILWVVLIGCGSPTSEEESVLAQESTPGLPSRDVSVTALLVAEGDPEPVCDDLSHGQLIYMKEDKAFFYCDETLGWAAIDLGGKDGRDGAVGQAGKDGKDSKDGRDGLAGKDGRDGFKGLNGRDGKDIATSEWTNPLSQDRFILVTGSISNFENDYDLECPGPSVQPWDYDEVRGAWWHFRQDFIHHVDSAGSGYTRWIGTANGTTYKGTSQDQTILPYICKIPQEG